jgi:hypothetical protein
MSFITDGIRDVFRGVRKVVKKAWDNEWIRTGLLIGGTLLTAGLMGGGWSAFGGLSKAAGGGIGGFFSAVGQTIATGWGVAKQAVASTWNWAKGTLGGMFGGGQRAPAGGTQSYFQTLLGKSGPSAPLTATQAAHWGVNAVSQQNPTGGGGGWFGNMFKWMFGGTTGAAFVRGAIGAGADIYLADQQWKREREIAEQANVWGGRAFGGTSESAYQPLQFRDEDAVREGSYFTRSPSDGRRNQAIQQSPSEFARSQMAQNNRATPILNPQPRLLPAGGGGLLGG